MDWPISKYLWWDLESHGFPNPVPEIEVDMQHGIARLPDARARGFVEAFDDPWLFPKDWNPWGFQPHGLDAVRPIAVPRWIVVELFTSRLALEEAVAEYLVDEGFSRVFFGYEHAWTWLRPGPAWWQWHHELAAEKLRSIRPLHAKPLKKRPRPPCPANRDTHPDLVRWFGQPEAREELTEAFLVAAAELWPELADRVDEALAGR